MTEPTTLTADEAIARLHTWIEGPAEEIEGRVIAAAIVWADSQKSVHEDELAAAVDAYLSEQVEMVQSSTGSFGCAMHADDARRELRESSMIIEVEGRTMGGCMLRARGWHLAYRESDGTWRGLGSSKREEQS